ncbi:hypothetical protein Cni_G19040 [Canna indica]|uniref:DUF4228 domain protein n=1 Tax=Canna indica TaxID=4628 RepID=A0AAQ3KKJ0_9LILI|nr:hypothetical protein Cni_G19040 [Canna indica]
MGNGASCVSASRAAAAKLVRTDGVVCPVETPAGAAEIMMEFPGHVVARADEVARTRRAAPMRADDELRPGAVYLLLPLDRVGSRLSDQQMEVLLDALPGRRRQRRKTTKAGCGGGRRVFPEVAGEKEGKVAGAGGEIAGFSGKLVGGCRQWRPALDTIHESKSN